MRTLWFSCDPLADLDLDGAGGVVAKDVDHLDHDGVRAGRVVLVGYRGLQAWLLAGAVSLPLVVEGVALEVPVDSPVVDPLPPMGDRALHILGHVVGMDHEVGQGDGDGSLASLNVGAEG